jgi:RES domain-containing protein
MEVYRIVKTQFAGDLSEERARLIAGRWNHPGTPCIYTAATHALSLLEYSAHVSLHIKPRSLSFVSLQLPDDAIEEIEIGSLPRNWREFPHTSRTRDFGNALLLPAGSLVLRFPSAIFPHEFNYLINPAHPRIKEVSIVSVNDYKYDMQ